MTQPKFFPALDTAAVEAMVAVVGTYTLDALRDHKLRAQHKQQCAERLKMNDGVQVLYSDQAILANLDWGIDSLEEAITTNNDETKVARLDHAEKMLQICALLDCKSVTAGVPNCYLSAWAHFNLAFVWKLRDNDRKAANHMLEMFLVDPCYSRVDFVPYLWEHLFLPHLSNVVNWYTKQRKSIVVSGMLRKMSEEIEMSVDISRDFASNMSVNVLDLSADQTAQLQALEKLYQDSLDENTKQFARYYKDWLNFDSANKKGMPLMPIAEPPMTEFWMPPENLPTEEVTFSAGLTMPEAADNELFGGVAPTSSTALSRDSSALPPLKEFNDFDNMEFDDLTELPTYEGDDLDDDPDSPYSNFRRPYRDFQEQAEPTAMSNLESEFAEEMSNPAGTDQNVMSDPRLLRNTAVRHSALERAVRRSSATTQPPIREYEEIKSVSTTGEIKSVPNTGELHSVSNQEEIPSFPNQGEIRSVPSQGEIPSVPNTAEVRSVPNSEEIQSVSNTGEIPSVPKYGENRPVPNSEEIRSVRSSGELRSVPNSGEDSSSVSNSGQIRAVSKSGEIPVAVPNSEEIRSVRSSGELRSVRNSGELRSVPNSGEDISSVSNSAVSKSGEIPAVVPNSEEIRSVRSSGELNSVPNSWGENSSASNSKEIRAVSKSREIPAVPNSEEIGSVSHHAEIPSVPNSVEVLSVSNTGEIPSVPNTAEIGSAPNAGELTADSAGGGPLGDMLEMKAPRRRRSSRKQQQQPDVVDHPSSELSPKTVERKASSKLRDNSSSSLRDHSSSSLRDHSSSSLRDHSSSSLKDHFFSSLTDSPSSSPRDNSSPSWRDNPSSPPRDNSFSSPRDNPSSSPRDHSSSSPKTSQNSPRGRNGRRISRLNNSSSSPFSNPESKDRKVDSRRTKSERYEKLDSDKLIGHSGSHQSEELDPNRNSSPDGLLQESVFSFRSPTGNSAVVNASNEHSFRASSTFGKGGDSSNEHLLRATSIIGEVADSSNDHFLRASTTIPEDADSRHGFSGSEASMGTPKIQELYQQELNQKEPRQKSIKDSYSSTGIASSIRTRFQSKYRTSHSVRSKPSSKRYQNDEDEPIVARSGPLLGRAYMGYQDEYDEPIVARSGPLLGSASRGYQDEDDEPIIARSGPLLGRRAPKGYLDEDGELIVARSGPLPGRASRGYQDEDDERIVTRSGPLLGRSAPKAYQGEDDEPIVARSGPLLGRTSGAYKDDEPIVAGSRPLRARASQRYQNEDDEPIIARSGPLPRTESMDSGSGREKGRSRRHRRSASPGSSRSSSMSTPLTRPPKDYVCPITSQLFNDPVTLETGQTYERIAIQEWLNRGNVTCPITRQTLRQKHLPKTNYVLKRLVDSWKEQYPDLVKQFGSSPLPSGAAATVEPSTEFTERSASSAPPHVDSPGSGRISRRFSRRTVTSNNANDISRPDSPVDVDVDGLIMDLKPAMSHLCTSEDLAECESVMLEIARLILQARGDQRLVSILNRAGAITGMMELLFNSQETRVLNANLFLLSVVIAKDDTARQTVLSADPEAGCLVGLLRKGLTSSASVLYQLKLPNDQLGALDLLPLLVGVIKENEENQGVDVGSEQQDINSMMLRPKSAAIMLLDQILTAGDQTSISQTAQALLALQAVPALVSSCDQTKDVDVRTSVVSLLLCCIQSDGRSRNMISKITNFFATVVDLLHSGNNRARMVAITFLNELVHLSRRTLCTDVLKHLKAEGSLSSMRILLVYLQMAPLEHRPVAASLLLQLDLLEEPRKGSIYREEAVDALVEALNSTDWPCPVEAANTLIALGGRFSYSGKPMMKAWLLKIAGIDKHYVSLMKEQDSNDNDSTFDQEEEERAAKVWEKKVAGALVGHDLGTLIESLGQGIQSKHPDVSKPCMIAATWLTYMLPKLPNTGIRQTARNCLLDHFVGVLQTSKDLQQRVLAALAIHSFISDPEAVQELMSYVKDVSGALRLLKKSTWTAKAIFRAFTTHCETNSPDLWVHEEQGQLDVTECGEVRTLVKANNRIFSGHSDGTIKIWEVKKKFPVLLQELKEHAKSVMALSVSLESNRMYSGSLDKSIRVWALGAEDIRCLQTFDLKDAVVGLLVNGPMQCIIPHGAGLKVQYEDTETKTLNSNKHVQSLAISDGKIICGCADNSLQVLDPTSESVDVIQHGVRTLIGKRPIYSTQVFQDHLYVAGATVEGVAGKVWKLSDHSLVGTMCTTSEVRSMAISEDFIYLGSSAGVIEVWLRERLLRVSTMNPGSKVICLMLDGDTLYSGHEDGKIRISAMG
ncbi:unnamed protein product [Calypogeia fissa]